MGMTTTVAENSGNRDFLVDGLSVDDIYDCSRIRGMNLAISGGMADGTFLHFRLK